MTAWEEVEAYLSDDLAEACEVYGDRKDRALHTAEVIAVWKLIEHPYLTRDVEAWRLEVMKRVAEILGDPS